MSEVRKRREGDDKPAESAESDHVSLFRLFEVLLLCFAALIEIQKSLRHCL